MMKFSITVFVFFFSQLSGIIWAQDILTLQEAAQTALTNNYGIRLMENNIRLSENNATKENNGYNPVIDLSVGPGATFGGSNQRFDNDMTAETKNALSWSAGATLSAGYMLYDKGRDYNLDQLKQILNLTNLQLRQSIEITIREIYNQYYIIAQLFENIKVLEKSMEVSQRRLERAKVSYEYSQGIKLDILNAEVDLRRDSVTLLNTRQQYESAKRDLNFILGVPVETSFQIDPTINLSGDVTKDLLIERALSENVAILISNQNQILNDFDLKIIEAGGRPTIGANANLNYNYQNNAPGSFISSSSNHGLNLGVTLNWNIFDGGRRNIQKENTLINIENQNILKKEIELQLERDIANTWDAYKNAIYVLDVEEKSIITSQANLDRTSELYNRGQVSSVEFRQAQLNQINAQIGLNNAKYAAKLLEFELAYLSGSILSTEL